MSDEYSSVISTASIQIIAEKCSDITEYCIKGILKKLEIIKTEDDYTTLLEGIDETSSSKVAKLEAILHNLNNNERIQDMIPFVTELIRANIKMIIPWSNNIELINQYLVRDGFKYDENAGLIPLGTMPPKTLPEEVNELKIHLQKNGFNLSLRLFERGFESISKNFQLAAVNFRAGYEHLVKEILSARNRTISKVMRSNFDVLEREIQLSANISKIMKGLYGEISNPVHGRNLENLGVDECVFLIHLILEMSLRLIRQHESVPIQS